MTSPLRTDPSRIGPTCPGANDADDATARPAPLVVHWSITRSCSGPCAHCLACSGAWPAIGGELSTMECLHVVDELGTWNARPLLALSGGDPLAREDLETIAGHATKRGVRVVVGTPGARLSERRLASLASSGVVGLEISLTSLDPKRHASLSHSGATLEQSLAAASRCVASGMPVAIRMLARAGALADLRDIAMHAVELGAIRLDVILPPPSGLFTPAGTRGQALRELSAEERDATLAAVAEFETSLAGRLPLRVISHPSRCECDQPSCHISPEGKLSDCAFLDATFGDLRRESVLSAWRATANTSASAAQGMPGTRAVVNAPEATSPEAAEATSPGPTDPALPPTLQAAFDFPQAPPPQPRSRRRG